MEHLRINPFRHNFNTECDHNTWGLRDPRFFIFAKGYGRFSPKLVMDPRY